MEIGYCVVFAAMQPYGNWLLCGFCCWAALWKFAILACRSGTCLRVNPTTPLCSSSMLARCHFSKETVFRQCIVVIFGSSIPTCYWTGLGIVLHPCNFLAPLIFTTPAYVERSRCCCCYWSDKRHTWQPLAADCILIIIFTFFIDVVLSLADYLSLVAHGALNQIYSELRVFIVEFRPWNTGYQP